MPVKKTPFPYIVVIWRLKTPIIPPIIRFPNRYYVTLARTYQTYLT